MFPGLHLCNICRMASSKSIYCLFGLVIASRQNILMFPMPLLSIYIHTTLIMWPWRHLQLLQVRSVLLQISQCHKMVSYSGRFLSLHCCLPCICVVPSSGPENVEAVSLSPYNIELHWEPPYIEDQNGNIVSYYISVTHISTGEKQSFETSGDSFFFSGNNFHPYYTYNITIYAVTVGIGPGTSVILTTMETGK